LSFFVLDCRLLAKTVQNQSFYVRIARIKSRICPQYFTLSGLWRKKMSLSYQDKMEIQELAAQYANALDSGKFDEWLDTWADDGVWEGGLGRYEGKSSLAKLPVDLGARIQGKRHVMCNFVINGEGDQATLHSYLLVFERESSPQLVASGVYVDVLKRIDGRWRFAQRTVKLDPSFSSNK
jgi:ketosteroid isomerase-like protein